MFGFARDDGPATIGNGMSSYEAGASAPPAARETEFWSAQELVVIGGRMDGKSASISASFFKTAARVRFDSFTFVPDLRSFTTKCLTELFGMLLELGSMT
jgi:hypothetical protein